MRLEKEFGGRRKEEENEEWEWKEKWGILQEINGEERKEI